MTVGIVGLGLIGGSFAKAFHQENCRVLAYDSDSSVLDFAKIYGAVDDNLTEKNISECDLVLVAVFPGAAIDYLEKNGKYIGSKPIVIDCCGTKRVVCNACFKIAEEYGFTYVGGHPMAGTHNSGFKFSDADLFRGAPMVLVPNDFNDIELLSRIKDLLAPAGFGSFSVTTADKHDEMIAFTSQMAHVVSNAYIKSPTAKIHNGFSAGSYKDMTRVAKLNPVMWAELFLENKEYLLEELDTFIANLSDYRKSIDEDDFENLVKLLDEGRKRKEEVDGK